MARHLESRQLILLKGVITTLAPSFDRARLARGSLDLLGLHHVPVGKGTDGGDIHGEHTAAPFEVSAASYMSPPDGAIELGRGLLLRLYREATPGSLVLVVIASCKDAALFLRDHQGLFLEKTKEVIIQGGVKDVDWASSDLASVELQPDSANNNTFDVKASDYLYSQCQQLGVPLTIASRYAAYAAKMPRSVYDLLALTGSPIGWRLRNAQRASIEQLWARACATAPEKRKGLPARCNREWFAKTFCSGRDDPRRTEDDAVWDLVDGFMQVRAPPPRARKWTWLLTLHRWPSSDLHIRPGHCVTLACGAWRRSTTRWLCWWRCHRCGRSSLTPSCCLLNVGPCRHRTARAPIAPSSGSLTSGPVCASLRGSIGCCARALPTALSSTTGRRPTSCSRCTCAGTTSPTSC